ncbi:trihelix transcription factor GT-3a-like, partial [Astyanax mexicanus]
MNRGLTWTSNEVQCLLDVWADDYICQLLQTTPKKSEVFKMFSKRMKERGFDHSPEQCHVKVKRLRQQDIKVRDALCKTGSSGEEKEKFPWFDDLDQILGTRPTVCPVDLVQSHESSADVSSNSGDAEL